MRLSFRDAFLEMTNLVTGGKWRRDKIESFGQYCMLGMVQKVGYPRTSSSPLVRFLDHAIPQEELEELRESRGKGIFKVNGGMIRGFDTATARVATYNNTRKDESEIIAWLDRANELAFSEKEVPTAV